MKTSQYHSIIRRSRRGGRPTPKCYTLDIENCEKNVKCVWSSKTNKCRKKISKKLNVSAADVFMEPVDLPTVSSDLPKSKGKQSKGLKRNTIDKYYTKDSVVEMCLHFIRQNIDIQPDDLIVEPSAGNGAFINGIKLLSSNYRFYDLEPEGKGEPTEIIKQDYLLLNYAELKRQFAKIHVIGNPPFGRQSSLAIRFIRKSCEFANSISFILPKSFKKDSLKKTFPHNFHLIFEIDLPYKSFLVDGVEYDVPCVFQIWEKKTESRVVSEKLEPTHFIFVKKTQEPDISVRRIGVNAGAVSTRGTFGTAFDEKSIESHYFIKFTNDKSIEDNVTLLSTIKYIFDNTVGPKSISKQELIKEFNKVLAE
jgi:predicted RNA methylase